MNIAVFFGGKSAEHDISIITALQAINAASVSHNVLPVYINSKGKFIASESLKTIDAFKNKAKVKGKPVCLHAGESGIFSYFGRRVFKPDAALICCHGLNGEDGTLQGMLELCDIPYSGSGVTASAVSMNKSVMKQLFMQAGLNVLPFLTVTRCMYKENLSAVCKNIKEKLLYPVIVKPANLGSSIGIGLAHDCEELLVRLKTAFEWDNTVVVENALTDFIEVNCAVLGSAESAQTSEVEQPVGWKEFLTYGDKYLSSGKMNGMGRKMPAELSDAVRGEIKRLARRAFDAVLAEGVARVDFLICKDEIYVNEINAIPGSLSNYLFEFEGIEFTALIDRLIGLAIERKKENDALRYCFDSEVLESACGLKTRQ